MKDVCIHCHGVTVPQATDVDLITVTGERIRLHINHIYDYGHGASVLIDRPMKVVGCAAVANGRSTIDLMFASVKNLIAGDALNMQADIWRHCPACGGEKTMTAAWRRKIEGHW